MNPYAKIAIKIGVVLLVCIILLLAYNMLGHSTFTRQKNRQVRELDTQQEIKSKLTQLLDYQDILPQIRHAQLQDIQAIRNLVPDADEFELTAYLRLMHEKLTDNHLETNGIAISGQPAALGGTDFNTAFASDITVVQEDLERITDALQMFRDRVSEMNNMLLTFQFYGQLGTEAENFQAIVGGIETHSFTMQVTGSYEDIKKFTYEIFNMRPRTALTNFQMSPAGPGFGATRQYAANFRLTTYGDANTPPPLWQAYNEGFAEPLIEDVLEEEVEEGMEEEVSG